MPSLLGGICVVYNVTMAADKLTIQEICPQCRGRGVVDVTATTPDPDDPEPGVTTMTCPMCNGEEVVDWGYIIVNDAFFQKIVDDVVAALP